MIQYVIVVLLLYIVIETAMLGFLVSRALDEILKHVRMLRLKQEDKAE